MASPTLFLDRALEPIRPWLLDDQVVEICANGPGEVWVERFGQAAMERHDVPALTEDAIRHLTERVAGQSGQSVNEEHPLLSAALPTGERFQGVLPPATTGGGAFAIRKQVIRDMHLDDYRRLGAFARVATLPGGALSDTDRQLCEHLHNGLISAATETSDFDIRELRRQPMTIFIGCTIAELAIFRPLIRILFQQVHDLMMVKIPGPDEPHQVLLMLDEFYHVGRMDSLVSKITISAGYGFRTVSAWRSSCRTSPSSTSSTAGTPGSRSPPPMRLAR